jgi:5'-3' exonuclease
MGVRGLQSYIRQYSTQHTIDEVLNANDEGPLRIGIDISFYMYKWQGNTEQIVAFIRSLIDAGHQVVLAFDGRAEEGKQWEAQRRRDARENEMKSADQISELLKDETLTDSERFLLEQKLAEHQRKGWSLTKDMRNEMKERFYEEKIPMLKAKGEADGLLAALSYSGICHIIISGDMDILAMGAQRLWTPVEDGLQFREYQRTHILEELGLTDWQFRSMCAVCFTEASQEVNNFSIQKAHQLMKVYKSLAVLKTKHESWLSVWPDDSHIFYRPVHQVEPWLREDQEEIYRAFLNKQPMPYT